MTPCFAFRVSRVQITTLYVKITWFALVIDFYTAFYRFQMLCALFPGPYKLPYIMAVIWELTKVYSQSPIERKSCCIA